MKQYRLSPVFTDLTRALTDQFVAAGLLEEVDDPEENRVYTPSVVGRSAAAAQRGLFLLFYWPIFILATIVLTVWSAIRAAVVTAYENVQGETQNE